MEEPTTRIFVDTCGRDFLLPYLWQRLPKAALAETPAEADYAVMVSHSAASEQTLAAEQAFIAAASEVGTPWAVLRSAPVVGTGMTGMPHRLALEVYRGSFMHTPDTAVPISVVHATDVARAVELTLGCCRTLTLSDGADTTLDTLADALAWRMKQKRVLTARSFLARIFRPSAMIALARAEATPTDCRELAEDFGFRPTAVTKYLRTHIYDESSL